MKSRANYKEYILDAILILIIVQLGRVTTKFILLKQLNLSLSNLIIITMISFMLVGMFLLLALKNNEKFNQPNLKIINMFNQRNKYIRICLGILVGLILTIIPYFDGGYNIYNIELLFLYIIIIPIFEELLFREYIWNYLSNYVKNTVIVFLATTIMYGFYQIGYIDIINQYMKLTNNTGYVIDILTLNIIKGLLLGVIVGIAKLKLKDTYICMLIHALLSILFY